MESEEVDKSNEGVEGQQEKRPKTDAEGKSSKGAGRERFRRTCWIPEVEPRRSSSTGEEEDENDGDDESEENTAAKVAVIEAPEFKFDHKTDLTCFGGVRPWLRKDEEWPRCGEEGCERLLQFFLQLDCRFLPDEARTRFAGQGTPGFLIGHIFIFN
jgi:hypothetical protein